MTKPCDKTGTYIVDGWQHYVPVLSALGTGRQEFRLVYEDGRLIESVEIPASAGPKTETTSLGYITMGQAAKVLRQSYWSLSRRWKDWGLKPRRIGKQYFFLLDDLRAMIARQRTPKLRKGTRARVVGLI